MALPSENMNLNLYRVFYTVAKTKSFSESTKLLHISQPAISKHIQNLEYELDTILFCRTNRGIELTKEAKQLLPYVEKAYNYIMLGERELKESKVGEKSYISLGILPSISSYYLKNELKEFISTNPNITLQITSASNKHLIDLLLQHTLDLIIIANNTITNKNLKEIPIYTDKYVFAAHNTYPNIENITTLNDIINDKIILPANHQELDKYLAIKELKLIPILESDSIEMILNYTNEGLGIGYLPLEVVKQNDNLKVIDINETLPEIKLSILYDPESITMSSEKLLNELSNKEETELPN